MSTRCCGPAWPGATWRQARRQDPICRGDLVVSTSDGNARACVGGGDDREHGGAVVSHLDGASRVGWVCTRLDYWVYPIVSAGRRTVGMGA
jgi:hypothetical protein